MRLVALALTATIAWTTPTSAERLREGAESYLTHDTIEVGKEMTAYVYACSNEQAALSILEAMQTSVYEGEEQFNRMVVAGICALWAYTFTAQEILGCSFDEYNTAWTALRTAGRSGWMYQGLTLTVITYDEVFDKAGEPPNCSANKLPV